MRRSLVQRISCAGILLTCLLLTGACGGAEPLPEVPPRQISESPFHYPEELWDAEIEGETVLKVYVTAAGQVDSVRVEETSGHAAFDTAAVQGAHRLLFEPARRDDQAVAVWVLLPVQFNMSNAAAEPPSQP